MFITQCWGLGKPRQSPKPLGLGCFNPCPPSQYLLHRAVLPLRTHQLSAKPATSHHPPANLFAFDCLLFLFSPFCCSRDVCLTMAALIIFIAFDAVIVSPLCYIVKVIGEEGGVWPWYKYCPSAMVHVNWEIGTFLVLSSMEPQYWNVVFQNHHNKIVYNLKYFFWAIWINTYTI